MKEGSWKGTLHIFIPTKWYVTVKTILPVGWVVFTCVYPLLENRVHHLPIPFIVMLIEIFFL